MMAFDRGAEIEDALARAVEFRNIKTSKWKFVNGYLFVPKAL